MVKNSVKIGALTYKIEFRELDEKFGLCDFENLKIILDPRQHPDMLQFTFLHECLHAIQFNSGVKPDDQDERFIDSSAGGLLAVLRDNKIFTGNLVEVKRK